MTNQPFAPGTLVKLGEIIGSPNGTGPIPVSKTHWYRLMAIGLAPQPLRLGGRSVAWSADDLNALIEHLTERR